MSIAEAVRAFLKTCPVLENGRLNVDYLPEEAGAFSLEAAPSPPVVKRYIDGGSLRQYSFVLAARTLYGGELRQQLENQSLFEEFSDWLDRQNRARCFPDLGPGRQVTKLEVTASGYVSAPGADRARYQIRCCMLYEQTATYSNNEED